MGQQSLERDMCQFTNSNFITEHKFCKWYGCSSTTARAKLLGLEYIPGKGPAGKRYLCKDVARMLAKELVT